MPAFDDWVQVDDRNVVLVWKCYNTDCQDNEEYEFYPYWFDKNGTPSCECGCDMEYVETRVKISEVVA